MPPAAQATAQPEIMPQQSSLPLFVEMAGDFLRQIGEAMKNAPEKELSQSGQEMGQRIRLHTDSSTGRKSLHIPLPDDQTLNNLAQMLGKAFNAGNIV